MQDPIFPHFNKCKEYLRPKMRSHVQINYQIGSYEQSALAPTAILKSALALSMSSMSVLFTLKASSNVESYESIHKFLEPLCTLRGNF